MSRDSFTFTLSYARIDYFFCLYSIDMLSVFFAVTSAAGSKIHKDTCINSGLFEDPANCRNYYWCQVSYVVPAEVN
jgi:hypothetical protein